MLQLLAEAVAAAEDGTPLAALAAQAVAVQAEQTQLLEQQAQPTQVAVVAQVATTTTESQEPTAVLESSFLHTQTLSQLSHRLQLDSHIRSVRHPELAIASTHSRQEQER